MKHTAKWNNAGTHPGRKCRPFLSGKGLLYGLSDVSLLEGRADRIRAGGRVAGADCDLFCGAVAVTVMVNAVADIAGNTLDVSLVAMISVVCINGIKKNHSL